MMRGLGQATHTLATLPVSKAAYDEVAALFKAAGYDHVVMNEDEPNEMLDMTGIALTCKEE